jgi:hypothetical protein
MNRAASVPIHEPARPNMAIGNIPTQPQCVDELNGNSPSALQNAESANEGFVEYFKKIISTCGGVVDVASFLVHSSTACRGETTELNPRVVDEDQTKLKLNLRKPAVVPRKQRKRQGATVEISSGFEDDVSALSDLTVDEMERLERFDSFANQKKRLSPIASRRLSAVSEVPKIINQHDLSWTFLVKEQPSNTEERSLGVSTSGSASSAEPERIEPSSSTRR